jgi:hypothetical protein
MSKDLDLCSICNTGYLTPTGTVAVEGESVGEFEDIGGRRIFICENCEQRQVRVGVNKYVKVGDSIKTTTEPER